MKRKRGNSRSVSCFPSCIPDSGPSSRLSNNMLFECLCRKTPTGGPVVRWPGGQTHRKARRRMKGSKPDILSDLSAASILRPQGGRVGRVGGRSQGERALVAASFRPGLDTVCYDVRLSRGSSLASDNIYGLFHVSVTFGRFVPLSLNLKKIGLCR